LARSTHHTSYVYRYIYNIAIYLDIIVDISIFAENNTDYVYRTI